MTRRKRQIVYYNKRYSYAPTYGQGGAEILFDYEFEKSKDHTFRIVMYDPGTDIINCIEEHVSPMDSAMRSLDRQYGLFLKLL